MGGSGGSSRATKIAEQQYNLQMKQYEESKALAAAKKTNALYSFQGKTSRVGFADTGAVKRGGATGGGASGGEQGSLGQGTSAGLLGLIDINKAKLGG